MSQNYWLKQDKKDNVDAILKRCGNRQIDLRQSYWVEREGFKIVREWVTVQENNQELKCLVKKEVRITYFEVDEEKYIEDLLERNRELLRFAWEEGELICLCNRSNRLKNLVSSNYQCDNNKKECDYKFVRPENMWGMR